MKLNSVLAFLLTLFALMLVASGGVWVVLQSIGRHLPCERFSVKLTPEVDSVELRVGEGKLVKVNVTNLGFEDEYRLGSKGANWVVVKPDKLRLNQSQAGDMFVYMSPSYGIEGKFNIRVFADSFCVYQEEIIQAVV